MGENAREKQKDVYSEWWGWGWVVVWGDVDKWVTVSLPLNTLPSCNPLEYLSKGVGDARKREVRGRRMVMCQVKRLQEGLEGWRLN